MKIIVAGFPGTGAELVEAALRKMGYKVYGEKENTFLLEKEWTKILNFKGTIDDIRAMYADVDVIADFPACYFWEEVLMAYPDAKVILTRSESEEVWMRKMVESIKEQANNCDAAFLKMASPTQWRLQRNVISPGTRLVLGYSPQPWWANIKMNECLARKRYRAHNAHVMQNCPKDQLLMYDTSQGWEPLCKFISANVPDAPFPRQKVKDCAVAEIADKQQWMKMEAYTVFSFFGAVMSFAAYRVYTTPPTDAVNSIISWVKETFAGIFGK